MAEHAYRFCLGREPGYELEGKIWTTRPPLSSVA
jgi:hypothetical protein